MLGTLVSSFDNIGAFISLLLEISRFCRNVSVQIRQFSSQMLHTCIKIIIWKAQGVPQ